MHRREALQRIGILMGGTLSASTIAGVLGGCQAAPQGEEFRARTLTQGRDELVATIAELIIPETDTPGARIARVHEFIDAMLTDWYEAPEKDNFLLGLATVDGRARDTFAAPFLDLTEQDQVALLTTLEEEGYAWTQTQPSPEPPFFVTMKALTLFGYYTSEVGATQELHVMPMGEYKGDVPLEEIGRTWA